MSPRGQRHALLAIAVVAVAGAVVGVVARDWTTVTIAALLASVALYGRSTIAR